MIFSQENWGTTTPFATLLPLYALVLHVFTSYQCQYCVAVVTKLGQNGTDILYLFAANDCSSQIDGQSVAKKPSGQKENAKKLFLWAS